MDSLGQAVVVGEEFPELGHAALEVVEQAHPDGDQVDGVGRAAHRWVPFFLSVLELSGFLGGLALSQVK